MKKYALFALVSLSMLLLNQFAFSQTLDVSYLNPTLLDIKYNWLRFGSSSDYYAGFMYNKTSQDFGDGNDFSIFTYGNRDITIRPGSGNIVLFPSLVGGFVGIGNTSPKSQLVVGSNFGANISGSGGGNAVFGTNLAIHEGGSDHNRLYTPSHHSGNYGYAGMHARWGSIYFYTSEGNTTEGEIITPEKRLTINNDGNVGVGISNPSEKLVVAGKIIASEIKVQDVSGADFVFEEDYDLPTLEETESFIKSNKHLPGIPSAAEMQEEGLTLGEMNMLLLQKIEEFTLYMIELKKENEEIKSLNHQLLQTVENQNNRIEILENEK